MVVLVGLCELVDVGAGGYLVLWNLVLRFRVRYFKLV